MIIVNDNKTLGSKGFAHAVFDSISLALSKKLDKDVMQEMHNEIEFFSELDLSELNQDEFIVVCEIVQKATNLDKHWQSVLIEAMQQDPRFKKVA